MTLVDARDASAPAAFDVAIVGGGPAGLSAALSLARARRRVVVFDDRDPRNRVAARMHGVLGHDGLPPTELLRKGRAEVAMYGGELVRDRVDAIDVAEGRVTIRASASASGSTAATARQVIVATGLVDELPRISGLREQWGRGVVVCPYCDGWERRDGVIGVIATGGAADAQAQQLRQWSQRVVLFLNETMNLSHASRSSLSARGIRVEEGPVRAVRSATGRLAGVELPTRSVPVDSIFIATRLRPRDRLLRDLAAATTAVDDESWVRIDGDGRTSIERVWAVGNVVDPRANVAVAMGAGSLIAGAVNAELTAEDVADVAS